LKEGKNIIFLLLILAMLIPSGVIVARNLNVDPISTSLSEDNVLKVLFIIENDNIPISTNIIAHYSQTRRAASPTSHGAQTPFCEIVPSS